MDGGQGGNAGLVFRVLSGALTVVKSDDNGGSWTVSLEELLYEGVMVVVLMGLGLVEKVDPAKEMLSSSCPPPKKRRQLLMNLSNDTNSEVPLLRSS